MSCSCLPNSLHPCPLSAILLFHGCLLPATWVGYWCHTDVILLAQCRVAPVDSMSCRCPMEVLFLPHAWDVPIKRVSHYYLTDVPFPRMSYCNHTPACCPNDGFLAPVPCMSGPSAVDALFLVHRCLTRCSWISCACPIRNLFLSHGCLVAVACMLSSCPLDVAVLSHGCPVPVPWASRSRPMDVLFLCYECPAPAQWMPCACLMDIFLLCRGMPCSYPMSLILSSRGWPDPVA